MTMRGRLLMAALSSFLILSLGAGSAAALRSLSITSTARGATELTSRAVSFETGLGTIICEATVGKTMSTLIPKLEGVLSGDWTFFRIANERCRFELGGEIRITTLGGMVRLFYRSFTGRLPNPTGIRRYLGLFRILISVRTVIGVIACLYEGELNEEWALGAEGVARTMTVNEGRMRLVIQLSGTCPAPLNVQGTFTPLATVTIRLV